MSELPTSETAQSRRPVGRGVALAAILLMIGNLASRVLGQVRETVIAIQFESEKSISLFGALGAVPTQLYDFLVGGLVSAALVPVFSDYLEASDRQSLWRLVNTVLTVALLALLTVGGLLALGAPWVVRFIATDLITPDVADSAVTMLYLMIGAVVMMGLSGFLTALLQAQQRFSLPAFTTSVFNLGMIITIMVWPSENPVGMALGMLLGATAQVLLQLPGLRYVRLRPQLDLRHPGVRKIGRLYAPVALGIGFSMVGTTVDRRLGSGEIVGDAAITYMRWATTLVQFTLGMVSAAISIAILPTLSRLDSARDEAGFRRVFGLGLKTVLLLSVPAIVILGLFGEPIVRLLFQYGPRTTENTRMTTLALWGYLPSILAVAIDQPLLFAFYARKHTLLPNLVQGLAVLAYCIVAFLSYRQWGMFGLIAANVVQLSTHALVMIWLGHWRFGLFNGQQFAPAAAKITAAALVMTAVGWGLRQFFPTGPLGFRDALLIVLIPGGVASLTYLGLLWWLKFDALIYCIEAIGKKFKRAR